MEKYVEVRIVNTFIYLAEVVLSIIFVLRSDSIPKTVIFGIACYLVITMLLLDNLSRHRMLSLEGCARVQLFLFVIIAVLMSYIFHSHMVLYFVMFVNSFCIFLYLNQKLSRLQILVSALMLLLLGVLAHFRVIGLELPQTDFIAGFVTLISINWIEAIGTGIMNFYIQKNADQEQSLDDLLKVVELKCEEAEKTAKAESEFLEYVSSEIKRPVNQMLDMTKKLTQATEEAERADYAKTAENSGKKLLLMVDHILDLSRIELGKIEVIPVKYHLSSLICDLYVEMKQKAQQKGLEFRIECDRQMPSQFYADELKLRQVLTILTTNAIKYSESGSVIVRVGYEKYEEEPVLQEREEDTDVQDKDWLGKQVLLCFHIIDSGRGIREKDREKLQQEFSCTNSKKEFSYYGAGLGHTVCSRLISMMQGEIGFESSAENGSVFWFKLPQYVISYQPIGGLEYEERKES